MALYTTELTFEERMHECYLAGKRARLKRTPVVCPHEEGTPAFVEWHKGFAGGVNREKEVKT